jgi:hypothetical protein
MKRGESSNSDSEITVFYFGKAHASPFEIKSNDEE